MVPKPSLLECWCALVRRSTGLTASWNERTLSFKQMWYIWYVYDVYMIFVYIQICAICKYLCVHMVSQHEWMREKTRLFQMISTSPNARMACKIGAQTWKNGVSCPGEKLTNRNHRILEVLGVYIPWNSHVRTWKWMLGRWSFPFWGQKAYFQVRLLLVSGRLIHHFVQKTLIFPKPQIWGGTKKRLAFWRCQAAIFQAGEAFQISFKR